MAAGDAVFFDRRIWHAAGHNFSPDARKALFYGYSYRWLRPRDDMTVEHLLDRCDPSPAAATRGRAQAVGTATPRQKKKTCP